MAKFYPAAIILYLNYFLHGIGCSVLGQADVKEALALQWNCDAASITAIAAALGLGRLLSLVVSGPLSDTFGRKVSTLIGGLSYAIYFAGLAIAPTFEIAYACAIIGGLANSFLDTGIYPAVGEIFKKAPGAATMAIKFFVATAQMLMPFFLGFAAVSIIGYDLLFLASAAAFCVLVVLLVFLPLPDDLPKGATQRRSLVADVRNTHFTPEAIAMIAVGFTCTGTFQLWLNCAQTFAVDYTGMQNPAIMQTCYAAGTLIAIVITAALTHFIKDVRFILLYPCICLVMLAVVYFVRTPEICIVGSFVIGWAGAGGLLQLATSVCNLMFPLFKGTITALVMIASSLCNYTILSAAAAITAEEVVILNMAVTGVGVLLGLFVNLRYKGLSGDTCKK